MSAATPANPSQGPSSASKKKKNNKKKSVKGKSNGDAAKAQDLPKETIEEEEEEGEAEDSEQSAVNTPRQNSFPESDNTQPNGLAQSVKSNGPVAQSKTQPPQEESSSRDLDDNGVETADASIRFEAMSQEREALRAEVEQLRKSLEEIQINHTEEISTFQGKHAQHLSEIKDKHVEDVSIIKSQHTEEFTTIRAELAESESAKEQAEDQYQQLLGRINTIKSSLGERLKADRQELAEAREQIEELETQNDDLQKRVKNLEGDATRLESESNESSRELSTLRNRHNLSQQNWVNERQDLLQQIKHLKEEAEAAREAMGDWEVLAMEERSMREALAERLKDLEDQYSSQKETYEVTVSERDNQSKTVEGLQRALQELQDARKRELREMVESYEEQLQSLKKLVQVSDTRALESDSVKVSLQSELDRLGPFEKEVKEKNLLIGKLRHEAIVLNDHLTKALRFLKKAKPEDNIDRQIVTNHFLHFLALDRSDPKKFQILQLIAALLNWTEEQKEQAGLARPGASNNSLRLPVSPFHRTPSTPSLSTEFFGDSPASKESLAELWTGFLERSAEEGSNVGSRSESVSSHIARPDTSSGDGASRG